MKGLPCSSCSSLALLSSMVGLHARTLNPPKVKRQMLSNPSTTIFSGRKKKIHIFLVLFVRTRKLFLEAHRILSFIQHWPKIYHKANHRQTNWSCHDWLKSVRIHLLGPGWVSLSEPEAPGHGEGVGVPAEPGPLGQRMARRGNGGYYDRDELQERQGN